MSQPYRKRSPETWTAARDAYLAGCTAEEVCARFDVGESAFHKRARAEGWRRVDQEDPAPEDIPADEDLPDIDDEALAAFAFRRMSVEARRGRLNRALAWGRLRDMALRQIADRARLEARIAHAASRQSIDKLSEINATARAIVHSARVVGAIGDLDAGASSPRKVQKVQEVHPVSPQGSNLSRAERRRQAARARKTGPP
ncbi:hypothetical protein [Brevundimonas subvibrioides]|uniref:Uncharacterized protein n=1 Tax=Brevundimonas subvibrioides (strain ATCC 15264 / DSM 4735 / LMG 14903 / NBRC 16000 / CB 81) TaxID=633149 RepID=D9QM92_BRESC|nr:hypothetical protein [Brevundimonas subvibrioides]ADL02018.1 hypothetical protein Bresu_2711 [Brevundimonas subvibrioides ATCC 15264]